MNSRKKLIAVGVVVIGALAYLLASGFAGHSLHDAEVSEIVSNPAKFEGKGIKVSGTVISGSVTKAQLDLAFNMKDKKKMWILGIVFLTTSALVYLAIMLAWLKVAVSFNTSRILKILIALVALIAGAINIRSYIKERNKKDDGCEVVDEKKRKKIFSRIKKITTEKKFILSIVGIMALAISINLVELACSAGLPLIFTQVLAFNNLNFLQYGFYMFLYILFFLMDDIVVFAIAMKTLDIKGISSKYGKYSHLIGGILMLLIGLLMIFKPEWLMFNFK